MPNEWDDSEPTAETLERARLVFFELKEVTDRLSVEGFNFKEITAGIATLGNEVVAARYGQSVAAAWQLAMAKNAARLIDPNAV